MDGSKIRPRKNNVRSEETKISTEDSKIEVFVIPTDEENGNSKRYKKH